MNQSHFLILGGLCAAGTLGGYGIRRFASGGTSSSVAAESSAKSKPPGTHSVAEISTLPGIPHRKSEDTVETLLAADPQSLYARLAAWIIDATEEEIAAYWNGYKDGKRTSDITELVFIHWTRLNPRGAIAAVAGSEDEDHAWWAWAAHDPKGALAAVLAAQHLGQLGMKLLRSDPDQAFALAAEMLKQCGGNLGFAKKINLGEGALSHAEETGDNKSQRFLEMLNTLDRERTIELIANSAQQDNSLRQIFIQ